MNPNTHNKGILTLKPLLWKQTENKYFMCEIWKIILSQSKILKNKTDNQFYLNEKVPFSVCVMLYFGTMKRKIMNAKRNRSMECFFFLFLWEIV